LSRSEIRQNAEWIDEWKVLTTRVQGTSSAVETIFLTKPIVVYDEKAETWYFSVVDIVAALIQQTDFQTARKYWNKLKERLQKEGSQSVTKCHQLKLEAADGKRYATDVADPETLLRIIQSVPSPKAEPITLRWKERLWLARSQSSTVLVNRFFLIPADENGSRSFAA